MFSFVSVFMLPTSELPESRAHNVGAPTTEEHSRAVNSEVHEVAAPKMETQEPGVPYSVPHHAVAHPNMFVVEVVIWGR